MHFEPSFVLNLDIVKYSADLFTPMPICTLYVGFVKKATFAGST